MLDLSGLMNHWELGLSESPPHVVIPLLGRFKGEDFQRYHLLLEPVETDSGFEIKKWLEWVIEARRSEDTQQGLYFPTRKVSYYDSSRLMMNF